MQSGKEVTVCLLKEIPLIEKSVSTEIPVASLPHPGSRTPNTIMVALAEFRTVWVPGMTGPPHNMLQKNLSDQAPVSQYASIGVAEGVAGLTEPRAS
jgi:hypothetical protein